MRQWPLPQNQGGAHGVHAALQGGFAAPSRLPARACLPKAGLRGNALIGRGIGRAAARELP